MRQGKEINQKWTGPKTFDICFCMILRSFDRSLISGSESSN